MQGEHVIKCGATMAGGPKDFGGTKDLVQLFGPPKAGRTKELGDQNAKANKAVDSKLECPPKLLVMSQDK